MEIALIAHDIRSCHNVGSLLRTAEGLGLAHVYLTGYTPYPEKTADGRLPHLRAKLSRQIHKTALGAEDMVPWSQSDDVFQVLAQLKKEGFELLALEQAPNARPLTEFKTSAKKIALLIGREVEGIDTQLLEKMDHIVEIPMFGTKESFNVVQASAMALYHCRFLADR